MAIDCRHRDVAGFHLPLHLHRREESIARGDRLLKIPDFSIPFPAKRHADAEEIEDHTVGWASAHGLPGPGREERVRRDRYGLLAAYGYPTGEVERVKLFSDWIFWLFSFDDTHIELAPATNALTAAEHILHCRTIISEPLAYRHRAGSTPFFPALRDLCLRLRGIASPAQMARFERGMAEFFLGAAIEAVYRSSRRDIPIPLYMTVRNLTTTMSWGCSVFIEVGEKFHLPETVWTDPDVRAATDLASNVISYTNDVLSCAKEMGEASPVNLPVFLARQQGTTLQDAVDKATARLHTDISAFSQCAARLRENASGDLDRYLTGLEHWMSGHLEWCRTTGRYAVEPGAGAGDMVDTARSGEAPEAMRAPLPDVAGLPEPPPVG